MANTETNTFNYYLCLLIKLIIPPLTVLITIIFPKIVTYKKEQIQKIYFHCIKIKLIIVREIPRYLILSEIEKITSSIVYY
jgi:hypothetical protein